MKTAGGGAGWDHEDRGDDIKPFGDAVATPSTLDHAGVTRTASFFDLVRRTAWPLLLPTLAEKAAIASMHPVIAIVSSRHGFADVTTGTIMATIGAGRMLAVLPCAMMFPRVGLLLTQLIGLASAAFGIAAYGFCGPSILTVFAAAFVVGLGTGVVSSARQPLLYSAVEPKWLGRLSALNGGCVRWAQLIGPCFVSAALHANNVGVEHAVLDFFAVAAVGLAVASAPLLIRPTAAARLAQEAERRGRESSIASDGAESAAEAVWTTLTYRGKTPLAALVAMACLLGTLRGARVLLMASVALRLSFAPSAVALVVGLGYTVDATMFWVGGWLIDHRGTQWAASPTCATFAFVFSYFAANALTWESFAVWVVGAGVAECFSCGLINALIGAVVKPGAGPTAFVLLRALPDAASVLGPVVAGALLTWTGSPATTAWALAAIALMGAALSLRMHTLFPTHTTGG